MSHIQRILNEWGRKLSAEMSAPWFKKLASGDLNLNHYKSYLRETYFHVGQNPQIQAFSTVFFPQEKRDLIRKYYQHAISEISHDMLALNDLVKLGEDPEKILRTGPLPQTQAVVAYGYYTCTQGNPFAYLGYLFHLEFMPTQQGMEFVHSLEKMGIPREAITFIEEHAEVDVHHNKLMEKYLEELVTTEDDINQIIESAITTCKIHCRMITDALEFSETSEFQNLLNEPIRNVS